MQISVCCLGEELPLAPVMRKTMCLVDPDR
jgi:hypothetical protein